MEYGDLALGDWPFPLKPILEGNFLEQSHKPILNTGRMTTFGITCAPQSSMPDRQGNAQNQ
jgi:hypothetical protein